MIFNPSFSFDIVDTPPVADVQNTSSAHIPITRLVDTLIETYRREIDPDESVETCNGVIPPGVVEDESCATRFTDVVREKSNRVHKKKDEPEKFNFTRAVTKYKQVSSFMELSLAKPLLKSLTEMSLDKPTPIQCACIPVALLHHDICACARTGSGKTLAFLLPILERLAKKPTDFNYAITRALVISPTRELAVQIFNVAEKLVKYCPKLRIQLAAGGLDLHSQEASLRLSPDLVIATPGRLIDHLSNAPSFNLQHIEYLVLDEADKLLDEYFTEQIAEIIKFCSKRRQTLLFSATMTESVINYTLPQTMKQYVHRVGRTARIMNVGRAVSLVGEADRKLLKQIMKEAPYPVRARVIPSEVIASYHSKITRLEPIIGKILAAEAEERELRAAQSQLSRAEELASNMKSGTIPISCVERRVDWFAERKRGQKAIGRKTKVSKPKRRKTSSDSDSE
ncbi:unnamed protein product [Heterobilharzia americana]|nr:unnamed protein product [Heterobilharzia americana]